LELEGEIDASMFKNTGLYPRVANQIPSTAKLITGRDKTLYSIFYFVRKITIQKGGMQTFWQDETSLNIYRSLSSEHIGTSNSAKGRN
jgi:hypothetical protein